MHFELWPQFSDFARFWGAFALKKSYYELTKQRKNVTGPHPGVNSYSSSPASSVFRQYQ